MDAVKHLLFPQEFYLRLGGMHIHIHRICRQFQMQHAGGEFAYHNLIAIGFLQGGDHNFRFHRPSVDEEGLQIAAGTGVGRLADKAGEPVVLPTAVQFDHLGALSAVDAVHRSLQSAGARGGEDLLAIPDHGDGHFRMGQSLQLYRCGHPAALVGVGFHKLHPGGGVEKQIPYDDGSALRAADFGFFGDLAGL